MKHGTMAEPPRRNGFTLLEVMVVTLLLAMILFPMADYFFRQNRAFGNQIAATELRKTIQDAVNLLESELRHAGYDPAQTGFDGILYDSDTLIIQADFNGDGTLSGHRDIIKYWWEEETLELIRKSGGSRLSLGHPISTFSFSFLDGMGTPVTGAGSQTTIRSIQLLITGKSDRSGSDPREIDGCRRLRLQSTITPVNLGL